MPLKPKACNMAFRRVSKKELDAGSPYLSPLPKPNKKVKNAQKTFKHGVWFDSTLELYMWERLTEANIRFTFKPKYILQPSFKYRGESMLPITLTSDYELLDYDIIIDPKGWANDLAPLKNKMLKLHLLNNGRQPRIVFPKNQVQCRELVFQILNGFYLNPNDPKQKLSDNQIKDRIKKMKKYLMFDGKLFSKPNYERVFHLEDIKVLERWDFDCLVVKIAFETLGQL